MNIRIPIIKPYDVFSHPNLYLLAVERTGWRRWLFGRWVYPDEPFRRDIQRRCAAAKMTINLGKGERLYDNTD